MHRSLSYADAVKMLGGGEAALVKLLDRFSAVDRLMPGIDLIAAAREHSRPPGRQHQHRAAAAPHVQDLVVG